MIDHRLAKDLKDHQKRIDTDLKDHQNRLDSNLAASKAEIDSRFRQRVEEYLGDQAAERQYRLEARKRLYTAVGPLRFQLILATGDLLNRVARIGSGKQQYPIGYKGYFGRSTLYRLLRVFGIAELIERQVADADFAVDPWMANLIKFKQVAFTCMSSSTVSLGHPQENWNEQQQHLFYDELAIIASDMIVLDPVAKIPRVMRFDEFADVDIDLTGLGAFRAMPRLLKDFTPQAKPILWLRLLALGALCNSFAGIEGVRIGILPEPFDASAFLDAGSDPCIHENRPAYEKMLGQVGQAFATPPRQG